MGAGDAGVERGETGAGTLRVEEVTADFLPRWWERGRTKPTGSSMSSVEVGSGVVEWSGDVECRVTVETDCDWAVDTVDRGAYWATSEVEGVVHWATSGAEDDGALAATTGPGTEGTEGGGVITPEESNGVVIGVI